MKWFCALIKVAIIPHILRSFFHSLIYMHSLFLTCPSHAVLIAIIYATFDAGDQSNKVGSTSSSGSSSVLGLRTSASPSNNNEPYLDPTLQYLGPDWSNERTVSKTTLGQTPFARCDVHSVRSEDGKSVINDWIFMEERDAVNVAVQTADGKFAVFRQHKYAIPGETLSPVGGFIDDGETPFEAARREVLEELGLGSAKTRERLESGEEFIGKKRPGECYGGFKWASRWCRGGGRGSRLGLSGILSNDGQPWRWLYFHIFTQECRSTERRGRDGHFSGRRRR